ncbi:MAG: DctP family TRAP transporter solute-binding subunit [Cloacibacillus sp.]
MKKLFTVAAALSLLFSTCTASLAAIELKLSHSGPTPSVGATNDEGCKAFKKYVEEKSKGEIKVKIFPNNQLGNEREQLEGTQMGTIQLCSITSGTLSNLDKQMLALDIPYLFANKATAYKFLDGPMGTKLRKDFGVKTDTMLLAFGENGFRHFTNRVRNIKSPADLKGLKIRTMENPVHIAMMRSMGVTPTPIPFGELYTALSQGVVDGQENPVSLIESSRLHEVQKYLTLDGHFYSPFVLIMNNDSYKKLSPEQKKIVAGGASAWSAKQREFNAMDEKRSLVNMKKAGVVITELNPQQLNEFKKVTQAGAIPLIEKEAGKNLIKQVLDASAKAAK